MSKYLALLIVLFSLAACAPPEPRYQLTAPTSLAGQQCAQRCDAASQQCEQQCSVNQEACRVRAEQQAKQVLPERLQAWEVDVAAWERRVRRYEMDRMFYDMQRDHWRMMRDMSRPDCRRGDKHCRPSHPRWHDDWLDRPISPGAAPIRPTLESETKRIQTLTCPTDCGCAEAFRQCFVTCGGAVKAY